MKESLSSKALHLDPQQNPVVLAHNLWFKEYEREKVVVPKLFHYTTAEGFVGIVTKSSVFATHINFLNDASEVVQALKVGESVIQECRRIAEIRPGLSGYRRRGQRWIHFRVDPGSAPIA